MDTIVYVFGPATFVLLGIISYYLNQVIELLRDLKALLG